MKRQREIEEELIKQGQGEYSSHPISQPKKKLHMTNQENNIPHETYNSDKRQKRNSKIQFILDRKLAQQMLYDGQIYQHQVQGKQFYFPFKKLNNSQHKFISSMFKCLDNKENLLIQSPTGTGKTLSLLTGALAWADQHYKDSQGGMFDDRLKIIYTSRAHSQLSQISKQLQKTPYRPKMLIFGSREKLCINQALINQLSQNNNKSNKQQKSYQSWGHKCSTAVYLQQRYLKNGLQYQQLIESVNSTIKTYNQKPFLSKEQNEMLQMQYEQLQTYNTRCQHYHLYDDGVDQQFMREIGRKVMNNEILKKMAKERVPSTVCPYFYPKRVKNRGTLYLMPYNYILDSRILPYSKGFLQNSIIIFDQGHNVHKTACQGYSLKLKTGVFQAAKRNILQKLSQKDFNADQFQMQLSSQQDQYTRNQQQEDSDEEMQQFLKQVHRKNIQKQSSQIDPSSLRQHVRWLEIVITNNLNNFKSYFQLQREQYKKADSSFLQAVDKEKASNRKSYNWEAVRFIYTSQRQKIQQLITQILFSQQISEFKNKSLRQIFQQIISSLEHVMKYFMDKAKKCFKIINLLRFYQMAKNVLFNKDYIGKFFIEVTQFKKHQAQKKCNIYKGELDIRCLAPQFAFGLLQKVNPRSIIITSGTLSPMKVFREEIGLKFVIEQTGHVVTQKNIIVRKVGRSLDGGLLKIDSTFYSGRQGLQYPNLFALFKLLIKTLQSIPHGVLVIVSSFSCLKHLQNFYKNQRARHIKKQLEEIKPHVYFQSKQNLQIIMERFNHNSQIGKGALMFCVCRAKLSEGIDFKDKLCRSVIFFGIPYVNKGDPFVVQKGHYLKRMKSAYASNWKFIQASKAINQGLGRVVRHARDYGSILLFDNRYEQTNQDSKPVVANISQWIKQNWKCQNQIDRLQQDLRQFYSRCQKSFSLNIQKIQQLSQEQEQNYLVKHQQSIQNQTPNKQQVYAIKVEQKYQQTRYIKQQCPPQGQIKKQSSVISQISQTKPVATTQLTLDYFKSKFNQKIN